MNRLFKTGLAFSIALMTTHLSAATAVSVQNAWLRLPPPGGYVSALYFTATNTTATKQTIRSVDISGAESSHIHETVTDQHGMSRMTARHTLDINGGQKVVLAPGGLHVMVHGLKAAKSGETVPVTLRLANGDQVSFTATTKAANE